MRTKWRVTTDDCVLCLSRTRQSMSFVLYGNFDPATRKVVYNIVCNKVYHYLYVDDRRYLFSLSLSLSVGLCMLHAHVIYRQATL